MKTGYAAEVICDSICNDVRLTTIEVTLPRIILAEFNTHRMLSRGSASSRAVPVLKRIEMVEKHPYVPTQFGRNQKGMQSGDPLAGQEAVRARDEWLFAAMQACKAARELASIGVHKEYANRLLEPFLWHTIIVTATEWENFWNLRMHKNASEPIRRGAELMWEAYDKSTPKQLYEGLWHLPYISDEDLSPPESIPQNVAFASDFLTKISTARCARVSYLTHDGRRALDEDVRLHDDLMGNGHMSPFEHAARPATKDDIDLAMFKLEDVRQEDASKWPNDMDDKVLRVDPKDMWFGNFRGWVQYRKTIPGEAVFHG